MTYDPDRGLEAIRALVNEYQGHPDGLEFEQMEELVREVTALDSHCSGGGKFPSWWCQGTLLATAEIQRGWNYEDGPAPEWDEPPAGSRIHKVTTLPGLLTDDAQDDPGRPAMAADRTYQAQPGTPPADDPA